MIGAGQAGLAAGHHLARTDRSFLLVDSGGRIGEVWRSRWDSLRLFTPAKRNSLPGYPFPGPGSRYPTKDEVADYLESYASRFGLPVRLGVCVDRLRRGESGFVAETANASTRSSGAIVTARAVVVAAGAFQVPWLPTAASGFAAGVTQVHSGSYVSPRALPVGPVLVVGGGNSGFQIAEELARAGRAVTLSLGGPPAILPQRFLGRDVFDWLDLVGLPQATVGSRLGRSLSRRREALIGSRPGRARRLGIVLRPRLERADGAQALFVDGTRAFPRTIVWATGFSRDYGWLDVPGGFDHLGRPVHQRGVSAVSGLGFVGLPWQHTRSSALLGGVGADAGHVVHALAADAASV